MRKWRTSAAQTGCWRRTMLTAFLYPILCGTLCLRAIQCQPEFILVTLPSPSKGQKTISQTLPFQRRHVQTPDVCHVCDRFSALSTAKRGSRCLKTPKRGTDSQLLRQAFRQLPHGPPGESPTFQVCVTPGGQAQLLRRGHTGQWAWSGEGPDRGLAEGKRRK